jgi:tetratricopeptide (TPR) repeat protein
LAARDPNLAARLANGLKPAYALRRYALATVDALLAEHRGEYAQAAEAFGDAATRWEGFEMPWEQAQALLGQGRCLLRIGSLSEATAALRLAREIFVSLGAKPALAETDQLLARSVAVSS